VRIALYGNVDLNLIDGSAIWQVALAETLALEPDCRVTVVLKTPLERDLVAAPLLGRDDIELVGHPQAPKRLTPSQALDLITELDDQDRFDIVLLRGFQLCQEAAERPQLAGRLWTYLTDIPQQVWQATDDEREALARIARASQRVLCQTDELRAYLEGLIPETAGLTTLLPPMIPETFLRPARELAPAPKLFYAGKFAPMWGFLETVAAFTELRAELPDLELHVAGDKIHNPPDDPDYAPTVRAALEGTPGLVWHGAVTRERTADLLVACDVALSARHHEMDASLELSTKILEYGAANVPAVINRNPLHERLYGGDYPLFIDHLDDLAAVLRRTLRDTEAWKTARDTANRVARDYTYPRVHERLERVLTGARPQRSRTVRRKRVVVAGHDLKFSRGLADVLRRAGAEVRQDHWAGHTGHDVETSTELLEWADVVWAEWCLGNAVWYSQRTKPHQRMVVRLHLQELGLPFPSQLEADHIDKLVCVADFMVRDFQAEFAWPVEKVEMVPNTFDTVPFDRSKLPGASRTLGMIGILPERKRFDRALDILELLLDDDPSWQLRIAGDLPWEMPWVWARTTEREYFRGQLDRIRESTRLRHAVRFDGHVSNIPGWFSAIGTILSVSDFESFHLALAEGMASRSVPVAIEREGVRDIYPGMPVQPDVETTAAWLAGMSADEHREVTEAGRQLIIDRYDLTTVGEHWVELLLT
jgi:glycosyltransferase involved in cell wall biosynthesis